MSHFLWWIGGFLMGMAVGMQAHPAKAHDWYPIECCSVYDCHPAPCDTLEDLPEGGIRDLKNGQVYTKDQKKPSRDAQCHVCTTGGLSNSTPICVFIVNGS